MLIVPREKYEGHDMSKWDFSPGFHATSTANEVSSDGVVMAGKIVLADFVCPKSKQENNLIRLYCVPWIHR